MRVVDSGLRTARRNLSLTEALLRAGQDGTAPDTLRFQHFPRSAIVGRHGLLHRELDLDWIAANGVEVARRMTGGGAIVMGPGMLGWELVVARRSLPTSLDAVSALLCEAVATGLRTLGVAAAYRPRNDVEVEGKKISGTGGYFDGDTLLFQGTVLIEADLDLMAGALNLPVRKLGKRGLSALAERVGDLRTILGSPPPVARVRDALAASLGAALGTDPTPGALTDAEEAAASRIHAAEIGTDAFVAGEDDAPPPEGRILSHVATTPGGTIEVILKMRDGSGTVVDQAVIAGDFFAQPPALIPGLEAALRSRAAADLPRIAAAYLAASGGSLLGLAPSDVVAAIAAALVPEPAA